MNIISGFSGKKGRPAAKNNQTTTPNHPEDKREHILDNALILFAVQSVSGTTVAQIAKASSVTSAMVHYYFTNREGLLDALVTERLAPALAYVWASLSDETLDHPRLFVTAYVDRLLEIVQKMPHLPLLWNREIFNAGGSLRERVMALAPWGNFEQICRALTHAQQRGQLNPGIEPALVLTSIMSMVMVPLAARDMLGNISSSAVVDAEILRRHALALLLEGLCPDKH